MEERRRVRSEYGSPQLAPERRNLQVSVGCNADRTPTRGRRRKYDGLPRTLVRRSRSSPGLAVGHVSRCTSTECALRVGGRHPKSRLRRWNCRRDAAGVGWAVGLNSFHLSATGRCVLAFGNVSLLAAVLGVLAKQSFSCGRVPNVPLQLGVWTGR